MAAVLLKPLEDAIAAGDPVRAIIRHTAVNQDGRTSGITFPSWQAQQSLMESLYQAIDLTPSDIGYIEGHGTGTSAGDIAEGQAIGSVFRSENRDHFPLYLGSVKSNIGHSESASGLAGLIKTILILEKGLIPATINIKSLKNGLGVDPATVKVRLPHSERKKEQRTR